jgi:hypothetical protein
MIEKAEKEALQGIADEIEQTRKTLPSAEVSIRRLCIEYAIKIGAGHDFKLEAMEGLICFLHRFLVLPADQWMPSYLGQTQTLAQGFGLSEGSVLRTPQTRQTLAPESEWPPL